MANVVILKGRMTRDAELRYTQGTEPKAYCMFSVAVNRMKQGEADFINCKAWGKIAELIAQHFTKGKEIYLQGRIEVTTSGEGENKRTYTSVVAERVEFCGTKTDGGQTTQQQPQQSQQANWLEEDDSLPF